MFIFLVGIYCDRYLTFRSSNKLQNIFTTEHIYYICLYLPIGDRFAHTISISPIRQLGNYIHNSKNIGSDRVNNLLMKNYLILSIILNCTQIISNANLVIDYVVSQS